MESLLAPYTVLKEIVSVINTPVEIHVLTRTFFFYFLCLIIDMSHMETRMSVFLDGFEFHVYNKSTVYRKLDKLFRGSEDEELEKPPSETTTAKQSGRFGNVLIYLIWYFIFKSKEKKSFIDSLSLKLFTNDPKWPFDLKLIFFTTLTSSFTF